MRDAGAPTPVTFPLPTGEWLAPNTPGHKVPSHGTDQLGQRYAYDFVHASDVELANAFWTGVRYWLGGGIDLKHSRGMNAPILSPISGKVIAAEDGWPRTETGHAAGDFWRAHCRTATERNRAARRLSHRSRQLSDH